MKARVFTWLALAAVVACSRSGPVTVDLLESNPTQVSRSERGMVVSGSPIASQVGARVLEQGGNAVDAAVATAFALSVVEPSMSGLGGRTQLLIRTAAGQYLGIDGGTAVSASYPPGTVAADEAAYGYRTIAVPGTVAALTVALQRYGSKPLAELLEPAIALARNGFVLPAAEAQRIANAADELREFEGSRRYFLKPDGSPYRAGERFIQSDLAKTLESIARGGAAAFYRGQAAELMANDVSSHGGWMQPADLNTYQADSALVVRGSYRGYDLIGTYLPASGATTIETLQILENFDLAPIAGGAQWAALVTQALLLAFEDRVAELGSPAQKAATLTSKSFARERARQVRVPRTAGEEVQLAAAYEPEHTTHLSVADGRGGVVALTQSLGPNLGSRVAAPGLGFLYAATMGYLGDLRPGERPFSSQSPLIVAQNDGVRFVLGAAGARRIIPAIVMVISRSVDQNLSFPDAMAAPRLHALADRIDLENRPGTLWSPEDIADLRSFGFTVQQRSDAAYFARIHGIQYDPQTRQYIGVADPRWQGAAAAPRR
jgi:gamma-glutamyltranspeptidase/glutathione hydrolase